MKKPFKIILFLLLAVPVIFIGCKKSEVTEDSQNAMDNSLKSVAFCGPTTTANLYDYGKTVIKYGTVTVGNDLNNLYVTYTLEPGWTLIPSDGTYFNGCYLFVGSKSEVEAQYTGPPYPNVVNPYGTGHFNYMLFPNHYIPSAAGKTTYQFIIPRSGIKENCPIVVAFAGITNGTEKKVVSARSLLKGPGYWFTHCMQDCGSGCETAYAKSQSNPVDSCFLTIPGITSNNWGWTNRITTTGTYDWPIYAGAGQCNITKGTLVGNLNVIYALPVSPATTRTATITFTMGGNVRLYTTHLYVGNLILPKKNNKWTTAPGQFPYKHENLKGVKKDSYSITGLSGTIYIAAHADVCW